MARETIQTNSREKTLRIAGLAADKKAVDVVALDMRNISTFCDYFVICSGSSTRTVKGVSDFIEEALRKQGISAHHIEGKEESRWILMDYGDVLVHIFHQELRPFYNLEWLWSDARRIDGDSSKK